MKKTRSSVRKWVPGAALIGLGAVSFGGITAFKMLFPHSGEQALDLVPDTALAAGTLDLDPAPSQAIAFKRIDDALKRNGFADSLEGAAKKAMDGFSDQKELWSLSKHSLSACAFSASGKMEDVTGAVLVPISDASKAEQILKTRGRPEFWKGTRYYRLPHSPFGVMLEGETLVASPAPWILHEMAQVTNGQIKPITQDPGFQEARAKEPSDASLIVMISPKAANLAKSSAPKQGLGWSSVSLTVQDGGLKVSMHGKGNPGTNETIADVAGIKPLRSDLMQVLPSGAYGMIAVSQPSTALEAAEASQKASDFEKEIGKYKTQLRKETGIDVENDIVPALKGDAVIAAYPSETPVAGVNLLLVADNSNGANPELLASKLQAYVDKQVSDPKVLGKNWVISVPRTDAATEFRLSSTVEKKMRDSVKGNKSDTVNMTSLTSDKTIAWANLSGTVIISSSQSLLDQAISAYQGKSANLASDAPISSAVSPDGKDQSLIVINLARIAQAVRNTTTYSKMQRGQAKQFDQVLSLFDHLTTPLSIQGGTAPDGTSSAAAFVPLEYDQIIDLVGTYLKPSPDPRSYNKV